MQLTDLIGQVSPGTVYTVWSFQSCVLLWTESSDAVGGFAEWLIEKY